MFRLKQQPGTGPPATHSVLLGHFRHIRANPAISILAAVTYAYSGRGTEGVRCWACYAEAEDAASASGAWRTLLHYIIRCGTWSRMWQSTYALIALSAVVDVVGQVSADAVTARGDCARACRTVAAAAVCSAGTQICACTIAAGWRYAQTRQG